MQVPLVETFPKPKKLNLFWGKETRVDVSDKTPLWIATIWRDVEQTVFLLQEKGNLKHQQIFGCAWFLIAAEIGLMMFFKIFNMPPPKCLRFWMGLGGMWSIKGMERQNLTLKPIALSLWWSSGILVIRGEEPKNRVKQKKRFFYIRVFF